MHWHESSSAPTACSCCLQLDTLFGLPAPVKNGIKSLFRKSSGAATSTNCPAGGIIAVAALDVFVDGDGDFVSTTGTAAPCTRRCTAMCPVAALSLALAAAACQLPSLGVLLEC
jgi:hypothetical protein